MTKKPRKVYRTHKLKKGCRCMVCRLKRDHGEGKEIKLDTKNIDRVIRHFRNEIALKGEEANSNLPYKAFSIPQLKLAANRYKKEVKSDETKRRVEFILSDFLSFLEKQQNNEKPPSTTK